MKTILMLTTLIAFIAMGQTINFSNPAEYLDGPQKAYALMDELGDYEGFFDEDGYSSAWDEFSDDSEEGTKEKICPGGGYQTTGTSKELPRSYITGVKVKIKASGLVTFLTDGALGSLGTDYEIIAEGVTLVTTAYECKEGSSRVCWVCFRYVLGEKKEV